MTRVRVGRQAAGRDDELGFEDRAHAGQRLDDLGLRVAAERLEDLHGQIRHDLRGDVLAGQGGLLGMGGFQAVAATVPALRTLRSASRAVSRARPRRIAARV